MVLADEVDRAAHGDYLRGVHVVVGVPSLLQQVLQQGGRGLVTNARVVVVDEVDECFAVRVSCVLCHVACVMCCVFVLCVMSVCCALCMACRGLESRHAHSPYTLLYHHRPPLLQAEAEATEAILDAAVTGAGRRPQLVLVGATVEPCLAEAAVEKGWLDDPVTIDMGCVAQGRVLHVVEWLTLARSGMQPWWQVWDAGLSMCVCRARWWWLHDTVCSCAVCLHTCTV